MDRRRQRVVARVTRRQRVDERGAVRGSAVAVRAESRTCRGRGSADVGDGRNVVVDQPVRVGERAERLVRWRTAAGDALRGGRRRGDRRRRRRHDVDAVCRGGERVVARVTRGEEVDERGAGAGAAVGVGAEAAT
ncbi:MAG: hypothetical protein ACK559_35960, partial [bacterium]